jgi:hypothetical protein
MNITRRLAALAVLLLSLAQPSTALAVAIAEAYAFVDWSAATFSHTGGALGVAFEIRPGDDRHEPAAHHVVAGVEDSFTFDDDDDGAPSGYVDAAAGTLFTSSSASVVDLGADTAEYGAEALGTVSPGANNIAFAFGSAYFSREIVNYVAGTLTVTVPYVLFTEVSSTTPAEAAFSFALADLFIENFTGDDAFDGGYIDVETSGLGFDTDIDSGALSVSLAFAAGELGFLDSFAEAGIAAVPAPPTMLLLGLALVLIRLRRR